MKLNVSIKKITNKGENIMDKFAILQHMLVDVDLTLGNTEDKVAIANLNWLLGVIDTLSELDSCADCESKAQ
mgnify:CR=1 FL=1